jgi:hypothetical protein
MASVATGVLTTSTPDMGPPATLGNNDKPGLSPEEEAQALRIAVSSNQNVRDRIARTQLLAPSARQQTLSEIINMNLLYQQLGNPFSIRRIPFSVLRDMVTDPMIAMGLFYIRTPLIRADWSIQSPDAQLAAAVDEALRPIASWLSIKQCGALSFGYQPMVKRFKIGQLRSVYRDPHSTEPEADKPTWTSTNIEPLLWDVPLSLAPENCLPKWNDRGEFNGFKYSMIPIPNPAQIGTTYIGETTFPGFDIPVDFAMWRVNEQEENFGCSPPDEPVLTTEGWVAIGDLDPIKHQLTSYDRRQDKIYRGNSSNGRVNKGYEFEKGSRPYSGKLYTIKAGDKSTRVTPNHKLTVKWSKKADNYWAVYLMRKGNWWRVGISQVHRDGQHANSGVGCRMTVEGADDAWIVSYFDNKRDALFHEALYANKYRIPDITFKAVNGVLTTEDLEELWGKLDSHNGAVQLLEDHGLYVDYPLYVRRAGYATKWTCFAANLIPDLMVVPIDPGSGEKLEWRDFEIETNHYEGEVVSLEVKPYHHYVSNGIVTQNSIFGTPRIRRAYRYFWSYWMRWALADRSFELKADPPKVVYYPTDDIDGLDPNDPDPTNPTIQNVQARALAVGQQARSGATLALPGDFMRDDDGKMSSTRKWVIEYLEGGENFDLLDKTFAHLDLLKVRALFLPESIFIGGRSQSTQGQTTARNVSTPIEIYEESQQLLADEHDWEINNVLIPQFIMANFPEKIGTPCRKVTRGFGSADTEIVKQLIQLIGQTKGIVMPVDLRELLRQANIPLLTQQQQKVLEERVAKEAEAMQPPVQNPEKVGMQGYNAGVAKTPLGNVYIQPPQRIDLTLSDVNDYMHTLPDIPPYKDATVRSMLLRTRKLFADRYTRQIDSFTDHLKDHTPLQLSLAQVNAPPPPEDVTTPRQEQQPGGLVPGVASATASAIVSMWFALQAEDKTSELFSTILGKIVSRSGKNELHLSGLDPSVYNVSDTDQWVDEYVASSLNSVDETIRKEFTTFLTEELEKTIDPAQIITDAQERFDETASTHASRVARAATRDAYNFGMLSAGKDAGISQVQAHDASNGDNPDTDPICVERNGQVMSIEEALNEEEHPNGTLYWTYLTTTDFSIKTVNEFPLHLEIPPEDIRAAYDDATETLFVLEGVAQEQLGHYALVAGGALVLR